MSEDMESFILGTVKSEPEILRNNFKEGCLDSIFEDNTIELDDNFKTDIDYQLDLEEKEIKFEKTTIEQHHTRKQVLPRFKLNPTCPRCCKSFSRTKKYVAHDMITHVLHYHKDQSIPAIELIRRKYIRY